MEDKKQGGFDPDAYYKKLQEDKLKTKKTSGIGLDFKLIARYIITLTVLSILLTSIIFLVMFLLGNPSSEIIEDLFILSIWLVIIPFFYNMSGFFVGRSTYLASASVSAWTGRGMDGKRSIRDMRSFLSLGKIMIFSFYMGAFNLIIHTLFF